MLVTLHLWPAAILLVSKLGTYLYLILDFKRKNYESLFSLNNWFVFHMLILISRVNAVSILKFFTLWNEVLNKKIGKERGDLPKKWRDLRMKGTHKKTSLIYFDNRRFFLSQKTVGQIINWKQTHNLCLGKFTL